MIFETGQPPLVAVTYVPKADGRFYEKRSSFGYQIKGIECAALPTAGYLRAPRKWRFDLMHIQGLVQGVRRKVYCKYETRSKQVFNAKTEPSDDSKQ